MEPFPAISKQLVILALCALLFLPGRRRFVRSGCPTGPAASGRDAVARSTRRSWWRRLRSTRTLY